MLPQMSRINASYINAYSTLRFNSNAIQSMYLHIQAANSKSES